MAGRLQHIRDVKRDFSSFAKVTKDRLDSVVAGIVFDLATEIMKGTPYDTGRAKASYRLGRNHLVVESFPKSTNLTEEQAEAVSTYQMKEVEKSIRGGDVIFISNSVPYINKLEFGGYSGGGPNTTSSGYSKQAPNGMFRTTAQNFQAIVKVNVAEVKGESASHFLERKGVDIFVFK